MGWDDRDAVVACRSGSFYYGNNKKLLNLLRKKVSRALLFCIFTGGVAAGRGTFAPVTGEIFASNISCFGDEYTLGGCSNTTMLPSVCNHDTDAAVVCQPGLGKKNVKSKLV